MTKEKTHVKYYQWLSLILLFIAILHYLPYFIWKLLLRSYVGAHSMAVPVDISSIIELLGEAQMYKIKDFNNAIKEACEYLHHCFIQNSDEYENDFLDFEDDTGLLAILSRFELVLSIY